MATDDRVKLTNEELEELIDREARQRLDMSGLEFIEAYIKGSLADSYAVRDIGLLVRLAKENNGTSAHTKLRRSSQLIAEQDGYG